MARHALGSGITVPAWVLDVVERSHVSDEREPSDADRSLQSADPYESDEWDVTSLVSAPPARLDELGRAHAALARLVEPATPRGILLLTRGRQFGRLKWLGPVRLIRQMLVVVIVMLIAFVLLALSPDIHASSGDIFRDSGSELLVNELFYLTAGGLGAAFYALFTAYQYIAAGTYDTTYESSYWIRYILGLIAGVVLPSLVPVSSGNSSAPVTRPLLALLGGFSAAVLYRILQRLVQMVEALAEGDSKPVEQARTEAVTARAVAHLGEERLALVGELVHLRDGLKSDEPTEQAQATVEKLLAGLAPHGNLSDSGGS
ncbi:MAG: hypothetical protein JO262_20770 [Solirubrobacterales bacterium]|nr:hypothetical protein [Solirubrobacterales bacterium]